MNRENIEEILKRLGSEEVPADVQKIAEETARDFGEKQTKQPRQYVLWENIMRSRITKLAAAAVIIIAVAVSITFLDKSVAPAYAVEQTINAMKDITIMHLLGRDTQDRNIEMWVQVNPDTGLMTNFYIEQKDEGKIIVSTPKTTYSYERNASLVEIKDGPALESPFRIGRFIEDMKELADRIGSRVEHYEEYDSKLNQNIIVLEITSQYADVRAVIDPITKLPIRFDSAIGLNLGQSFSLKNVEIFYEKQSPEGIFEFAIPDGAKVIRNTVDRRDELLSAEIIQYAHEVDAKCAENSDIPCYTPITVVDDEMNVSECWLLDVKNDSERILTDEICYGNLDLTELAVFDEKGNKLETRLVQEKPLSPGRFRGYIKLNEPLLPGQSRYFVCWVSHAEPCPKTGAENIYSLTMDNFPGEEVLESFVLVLAPNLELVQSTQNHTSYENINGHSVYVWQEHILPETIHKVTVELQKRE